MSSDFHDFNKSNQLTEEPIDISKVKIDEQLPPREKQIDYLKQTNSSTKHKVGTTTVQCVFGETPIAKMLSDLIES